MKVLDLFSGIGGFSLGLERAGMKTVAFCEIEEYPCKVLAKRWPKVPIYNDVRELTYERLKSDGISRIDVISGGFPCQDISVAGNQKGINSETRSGLWSECARLLGEIRPRYAIFENVTALLNGGGGDWFKRVLWDISQVGYDAEWHCIPASELGAHHHRDRIWIIAYPKSLQCNGKEVGAQEPTQGRKRKSEGCCRDDNLAYTDSDRSKAGLSIKSGSRERKAKISKYISDGIRRKRAKYGMGRWSVEPNVGRVADGISDRSHRLKGLGNAVFPEIPELIGRAIMEIENAKT